jgi:hypothetical protein
MITFPEPERAEGQSDALLLACEPLPTVRIAFIGLGKRGKEAFNHYLHIEGVRIVAICDIHQEKIDFAQNLLREHGLDRAAEYRNPEGWRAVCERNDIDLVYVCTHWHLHVPIATYAMTKGKHVAVEVPAALTLHECWQLVNTAEKTRRHCFMLENCCYDYFEMAILNMVQQGVLGEIVHCEGGYIHDLRALDFSLKPEYLRFWSFSGNPYPTHGLGPICQVLNIHRGDRLHWLVSVSGNQFGYPRVEGFDLRKLNRLGNMNTTIIKTIKGKTIVLQHDITSPRPYSRNYLVSGTRGFAQKRSQPEIALEPNASETLKAEDYNQLLARYEHPFYRELGELARRVGSHGGMDFIMDYRLIYCLRNGLPLDQDVYDAAEWSSIVELSALSVSNGSTPVEIPDFTRGAWSHINGLRFAE